MNETIKALKFTKTHEWLSQDDNNFIVGITDYAQELLGDLVFVEFPEIGKNIDAGDELGVIESVKAASDFYSPVAGEVIAVNEKIKDDPGLINKDPFGEGWLVKIKTKNTPLIDDLLDHEQYKNIILSD